MAIHVLLNCRESSFAKVACRRCPPSTPSRYVDVYDGKAYKRIYAKDASGNPCPPPGFEEFAKDPRNLLLSFVTDGFLPFGDDHKYSVWPLALTIFNLPPWLRCGLDVLPACAWGAREGVCGGGGGRHAIRVGRCSR